MKNRLGLSAKEFLDAYTVSEFNAKMGFSLVLLKMQDDERKACPFVSPEGCMVYEDRPGSCRMYPIGRAAQKQSADAATREQYFVVREPHCLGFEEDKDWTIKEWLEDQGLDEYNALNDYWTEIITSSNPRRHQGIDEKKAQMFYMASYNIDMFRKFVLSPQFLGRFNLQDTVKSKLEDDDVELMKFAMQWLKFSLFGEGTIDIRDDALKDNFERIDMR
jgi:Fe-S-cluster containining protein